MFLILAAVLSVEGVAFVELPVSDEADFVSREDVIFCVADFSFREDTVEDTDIVDVTTEVDDTAVVTT